jgi:hypothetical protein
MMHRTRKVGVFEWWSSEDTCLLLNDNLFMLFYTAKVINLILSCSRHPSPSDILNHNRGKDVTSSDETEGVNRLFSVKFSDIAVILV